MEELLDELAAVCALTPETELGSVDAVAKPLPLSPQGDALISFPPKLRVALLVLIRLLEVCRTSDKRWL